MKIIEENEYGLRIKTDDGHIITYPLYDPLNTENLLPKLSEFAKSHDFLMRELNHRSVDVNKDLWNGYLT